MLYRFASAVAAVGRGGYRVFLLIMGVGRVAALVLLLAVAGAAQGQYLGPRVDYAGGNQPLRNPVIKDISGDGILDVVVGNTYGNTISVYLGLGNGSFSPRTDYASSSAQYMAIADVNNDGILDVVTDVQFGVSSNRYLSVLIGTGSGTFGTPTYYSFRGLPSGGLVVTDVTGDGQVDLVYTSRLPPYELFVGPGIIGGFGVPTSTTVSGPGVALVDVNADGIQDLITAGVSVALGLGGGRFGVPTTYPGGGFSLVGDVNGDGRMDFVDINQIARTGIILLGQSGGGFSAPAVYPLGLPAAITFREYNMALGDVTADGRADLLITDPYSGSFAVAPTLSGGGFGPSILYSAGTNPLVTGAIGVATADLNGDGRADVVTSNLNSISVYLNQSTPTATFAPAGSALSALTLYPNPAHTTFTLTGLSATASPTTATLRNALGQTVRTVALAPAAGQAELSVAGLPPGVYTLHLLGAGPPVVRRLVVE